MGDPKPNYKSGDLNQICNRLVFRALVLGNSLYIKININAVYLIMHECHTNYVNYFKHFISMIIGCTVAAS